MSRQLPRRTRTDTLCPYTTLFVSARECAPPRRPDTPAAASDLAGKAAEDRASVAATPQGQAVPDGPTCAASSSRCASCAPRAQSSPRRRSPGGRKSGVEGQGGTGRVGLGGRRLITKKNRNTNK